MWTIRQTYEAALEHYGVHSQMVKCMEECGELIQALARNLSGEHNEENVAEELADVEIMIQQMRLIFGGSVGYNVDIIKAQKVARLKKRIEEEEE